MVYVLFSIIASTNLLTQNETDLRFIIMRRWSKALLMPSLLVIYMTQAYDIEKWIVLALIFGWIGDVLLMGFRDRNRIVEPPWSFMAGLSAFLIGHVFYVLYFYNLVNWDNINTKFYGVVIVLCLYALILVKGIKPRGTLLIGMTLYMLVIGLMLTSILALLYSQQDINTVFITLGALLFCSSDSVLAFRRIKKVTALPNSYVMFSYISGQFLIILGIL